MIYLDNAATTMINKEVANVISDSLYNDFANPSSLYKIGCESEMKINKSRKIIADCINAKENEIYFSSCASESNNLLIYGLALARKNWGKKVITTAYEHPAVIKPFELLKEYGFDVVFIKPNKQGIVDTQEILDAVDSKTVLVSTMQVNNETGSIIDIASLSKKIKEKNSRTAIHIDAVQSFMKYKIDVSKLNIDCLTFSGHKIYAPKGVGGFYLKKGVNIKPVFIGGGQEKGLRTGTENIHYIIGLAKACEILKPDILKNLKHYTELKGYLLEQLKQFDNVVVNSPENAAPYTVNFSFMGYRSETLLHFLESYEIYISSGSACSKGSKSHTLSSMSLDDKIIDSAIRVSFGVYNTKQDIDSLIDTLKLAIEKLQKVK